MPGVRAACSSARRVGLAAATAAAAAPIGPARRGMVVKRKLDEGEEADGDETPSKSMGLSLAQPAPATQAHWPAPLKDITAAREWIRQAARSSAPVLLCPDRDADGLSSGVIMHRTLVALGKDPESIQAHFFAKGNSVHTLDEQRLMQARLGDEGWLVVLDQGSRGGPPLVHSDKHKSLIIDHHYSTEFPERAQVVSAALTDPIATSSLLTYDICLPLHHDIASQCGWLAAVGAMGDLGTTLKFERPFPDLNNVIRDAGGRKAIGDIVSLVNAPRRTAEYNVSSAWEALLPCTSPSDLLDNPERYLPLKRARQAINLEVERCSHVQPVWSKDGRIAVQVIASSCQVHPVIATKWAGFLKSKVLEAVCVANKGYLDGQVMFSCRIVKALRNGRPDGSKVDLQALLKSYLNRDPELATRIGPNFAQGHREASGGIVSFADWERFVQAMEIGVPSEETLRRTEERERKKAEKNKSPQKTTLDSFFKRAAAP